LPRFEQLEIGLQLSAYSPLLQRVLGKEDVAGKSVLALLLEEMIHKKKMDFFGPNGGYEVMREFMCVEALLKRHDRSYHRLFPWFCRHSARS
jgi:hypothetical protein